MPLFKGCQHIFSILEVQKNRLAIKTKLSVFLIFLIKDKILNTFVDVEDINILKIPTDNGVVVK